MALAQGRGAGSATRLDVVSTMPTSTPALFPWLCLFGSRDSAAWEEPAFVRMSMCPGLEAIVICCCSGGEGRQLKVFLTIVYLQPFYLGCVFFDF